eukprot:superscaffoldBa00008700_g23570
MYLSNLCSSLNPSTLCPSQLQFHMPTANWSAAKYLGLEGEPEKLKLRTSSFSKVQPHILIGSDNPFLITPIEPNRMPLLHRSECKLEENPELADIYNNKIS